MWIFSMFTFLILRHHFYSVGVLMPLHASYWKILSVTDLYKPARRSPNRGSPEHASLLRSRTVAFLSLSLQFGPTWPAISRPRDSDRPCAVDFLLCSFKKPGNSVLAPVSDPFKGCWWPPTIRDQVASRLPSQTNMTNGKSPYLDRKNILKW